MATPTKSAVRRPPATRRRGAARSTPAGPRAVGGAAGRPKANPILLGGLGLVAVAALARVAMPGLFGGGSHPVASFPAPLTDRHFLGRAAPSTAPAGPAASGPSRPGRDPFTPPPGFTQ